jgi:hypothetical protein
LSGGYPESRTGTGFFVVADGTLVTASHLVYGPTRGYHAAHVVVGVTDPGAQVGERRYDARVIGVDGRGDVAVLRLIVDDGHTLNNIPILQMIDHIGEIQPGDRVMMIGNPLGLDPLSCAVGVVRDQYWTDPTLGLPLIGVMTDIHTTPGNSGSPVITSDGRVVSMHTDAFSSGHNNAGTSFGGGVASWHIQSIVRRLIDGADKSMVSNEGMPYMLPKLWFSDEYGLVPNTHVEYNRLLMIDPNTVSPIPWSDVDGFLITAAPTNSVLTVGDVMTHVDGTAVGIGRSGVAPGDVFWYLPITTNEQDVRVTRVRGKNDTSTLMVPVTNIVNTTIDVSDQVGDQAIIYSYNTTVTESVEIQGMFAKLQFGSDGFAIGNAKFLLELATQVANNSNRLRSLDDSLDDSFRTTINVRVGQQSIDLWQIEEGQALKCVELVTTQLETEYGSSTTSTTFKDLPLVSEYVSTIKKLQSLTGPLKIIDYSNITKDLRAHTVVTTRIVEEGFDIYIPARTVYGISQEASVKSNRSTLTEYIFSPQHTEAYFDPKNPLLCVSRLLLEVFGIKSLHGHIETTPSDDQDLYLLGQINGVLTFEKNGSDVSVLDSLKSAITRLTINVNEITGRPTQLQYHHVATALICAKLLEHLASNKADDKKRLTRDHGKKFVYVGLYVSGSDYANFDILPIENK